MRKMGSSKLEISTAVAATTTSTATVPRSIFQ